MLNLEVPNCKTEIVNCEPTKLQQDLMVELADRADVIQGGSVDPREDNMLKITSDGRKVGLDPRLVNPTFEDNPNTKLNQCVENVFRIWDETALQKSTQLIFCDLGTPKRATAANEAGGKDMDEIHVSELDSLEESGDFCIYDDIKQKLISRGIPEDEIAYIHDAKTEQQKSELFSKVREGKVRVLLGSTAKMGTGTNVQDKLIALHDLDVPWRPADMTQRLGRMVRQGNENKEVQLYRYVTKGSFDAYSYQLLEQKQRMISQIMTSKESARTCMDVDQEALSYAEIKTLCTGDERIKEKMVLDKEVTELKIQERDYRNTRHEMEDLLKSKSEQKIRHEEVLTALETDKSHIDLLPKDPEAGVPIFKMTINGTEYTDKKEAAKAFAAYAPQALFQAEANGKKRAVIGDFHGFTIEVEKIDTIGKSLFDVQSGTRVAFTGAHSYYTKPIHLKNLNAGSISRMENMLFSPDKRIAQVQDAIARCEVQLEHAKHILAQPEEFPKSVELHEKQSRLDVLTVEIQEEAQRQAKEKQGKTKRSLFSREKQKRVKASLENAKKNDRPERQEKAKSQQEQIGS